MSGRGDRGRGERGGYRRAGDRGASPRRGGFSPGRGRGELRGRGGPSSRGSPSPSRGPFAGPERGGRPYRGTRGGYHGRGQSHGGPLIFRSNNIPQPSADVTALEAEYAGRAQDPIQALDVDMESLSVVEKAPRRPGYVSIGNPCVVWANYMEVGLDEALTIYKYAITIKPEPRTAHYHRIVQLLLEDKLQAYQRHIATDWRSILLLPAKLPEALLDVEIPVQYADGYQNTIPPNSPVYQITLGLTGQHSHSEILEYVRQLANSEFVVNKENIIQALNIILNHKAKGDANRLSKQNNMNFPLTGQAFPPLPLGGGKQVLKGFLTSFRPVTGRTLVNMQLKHATVWAEGPLTAIIDQNPALDSLHRAIRGIRIDLNHTNRIGSSGTRIPTVLTISGFATQRDGRPTDQEKEANKRYPPKPPSVLRNYASPSQVKFWNTGTVHVEGIHPNMFISVEDYFKRLYALNLTVDITNSRYPVVNVGTTLDPVYVPAEVCRVMPGQLVKGTLSPVETAAMIKHSLKNPFESASEIVHRGPGAACLDESNETLRIFGVDLDRSLITVNAQKLEYPPVMYKKNNHIEVKTKGSWNLSGVKFIFPVRISSLAVINFTTPRSTVQENSKVKEFASQFIAQLEELGMVVERRPEPVTMQRTEDVVATVESGFKHIGWVSMILVILPDQNRDLYDQVKRYFETSKGIMTQCCLAEKVKWNGPVLRQYLANIAMKINAKCGGQNHALPSNRLGPVAANDTMLVGMDVTHPSPGSSANAPSIASMVASIDSSLGQWPTVIRIQEQRKEIISEVAGMFKSRLEIWRRNHNNSHLPRNIIIYRDGVSEGQYDQVMDFEFAQMREACRQMYSASDTKNGFPRMSLIVVGKRHHTRFYPTKESDMDKRGNLCSGTLVDRGVTFARTWDFFLQSHEAIQGTARPAHYIVLHDEVFKNFRFTNNERQRNVQTQADLLADFTYNLCHVWCRATRAVSICPPAYYADIACERARRYLASVFEPGSTIAAPGPLGQSDESGVSSLTTAAMVQSITVDKLIADKMFYI